MAKRKNGGAQGKRYEMLLSDPKHKPRKQREPRRYDKVLNLLILAALLYGGTYMIPAKDKEEIAEMLGDLPGEFESVAAGTGEATETATASLSTVLASFLPDFDAAPVPAATGTEAIVDTAAETDPAETADSAAAEPAKPAGFVGRVFAMSDFPRAYSNWQRTEFASAETAAEALQRMNRFLETAPVEITPVADLRDRKAALYEDGANLRFLILVEVGQPAAAAEIVTASAEPAPAVMIDVPSAMGAPRAEMSVTDAASGGLIARARIADAGRRSIELAGIRFVDHAEKPQQNIVDLRAELPGARAIYVRGRAPLTVIEDFLSRANLTALGVKS